MSAHTSVTCATRRLLILETYRSTLSFTQVSRCNYSLTEQCSLTHHVDFVFFSLFLRSLRGKTFLVWQMWPRLQPSGQSSLPRQDRPPRQSRDETPGGSWWRHGGGDWCVHRGVHIWKPAQHSNRHLWGYSHHPGKRYSRPADRSVNTFTGFFVLCPLPPYTWR